MLFTKLRCLLHFVVVSVEVFVVGFDIDYLVLCGYCSVVRSSCCGCSIVVVSGVIFLVLVVFGIVGFVVVVFVFVIVVVGSLCEW